MENNFIKDMKASDVFKSLHNKFEDEELAYIIEQVKGDSRDNFDSNGKILRANIVDKCKKSRFIYQIDIDSVKEKYNKLDKNQINCLTDFSCHYWKKEDKKNQIIAYAKNMNPYPKNVKTRLG